MMLPSFSLILALTIVGTVIFGVRRRRSYLVVNPAYAERLKSASLSTPEAFLGLPAVIVSGHPDRNVARVTIRAGSEELDGFLKREHCVRVKERLLNALAGFGFVSKSHREAITLERARKTGVPCPNWVAYGECKDGQAFLLIEKLNQTIDLRSWAANSLDHNNERRTFARALGRKLAQMHNAGFDHPDLYAKHVLVNELTGAFHFLDWQRSSRPRRVGWKQRFRDLAALHATLPKEAFLPRDRLACLFAYIGEARSDCGQPIPRLSLATSRVKRIAAHLMTRRHVHQPRQVAGGQPAQNVIWLKGEELCVTPAFLEHSQNANPDFLTSLINADTKAGIAGKEVALSDGRLVVLTRRQQHRPLSLLLATLLGRKRTAPEVRHAGLIFRLQRFGIATPKLLAFGQSLSFPGRLNSFLLTEPNRDAIPFFQAIREHTPTTREGWSAGSHALIYDAAQFLWRIHDSGCRFKDAIDGGLDLVVNGRSVGLRRIDNVVVMRGKAAPCFRKDLVRISEALSPLMRSRADLIRLVRAYLGLRRLDAEGKTLCRHLLRRTSHPVSSALLQRALTTFLRSSFAGPLRMAWRGSP